MTITEFLRDRIDEDEFHARAASGWQTGSRHEGQPLDWSIHMDRWSPDRVLAECESKRRIVEMLTARDEQDHPAIAAHATGLRLAVKELASVYADHPDYRDEWRV